MNKSYVSEDIIAQSWGDNPSFMVILLHGLGADASDLVFLGEHLKHSKLAVRMIYVNAPRKPIVAFGGQVTRAWFSLNILDWEAPITDAAGLYSSCDRIAKIVGDAVDQGISSKNIFLGGFSQGGFVALITEMTFNLQIGGVFALSSFMRKQDLPPGVEKVSTPLFVAEGMSDITVPESVRLETKNVMEGLTENNLTYKKYDAGHQIVQEEILDLRSWMHRIMDA